MNLINNKKDNNFLRIKPCKLNFHITASSSLDYANCKCYFSQVGKLNFLFFINYSRGRKKKIPDFLVLFSKFRAILDFLLDQTQF